MIEEAVAKQVNDYKIKLQKADQEIATLQATVCFWFIWMISFLVLKTWKVARLETQVTRFRVTAETLEKSEDELKAEKRKLQREVKCIFVNYQVVCGRLPQATSLFLATRSQTAPWRDGYSASYAATPVW